VPRRRWYGLLLLVLRLARRRLQRPRSVVALPTSAGLALPPGGAQRGSDLRGRFELLLRHLVGLGQRRRLREVRRRELGLVPAGHLAEPHLLSAELCRVVRLERGLFGQYDAFTRHLPAREHLLYETANVLVERHLPRNRVLRSRRVHGQMWRHVRDGFARWTLAVLRRLREHVLVG
jgi:hypothetical protein